MIRFNIAKRALRLTLAALVAPACMFTASCTDPDSELVAFSEDNSLSSPNDTVYSLLGIIEKMRVVADRTILLGELRGDLTTLTSDASLDLQEVANFKVGASNPYNQARDCYSIIQNCNYYLANVNADLTIRGRKVFDREIAVVKAYRAWTYLQLVLNYGSVPFVTEPLEAEKDTDPSLHPFYNLQQVCDYFIADLAPWIDTPYPDYGAMGGMDSRTFFYPVRVLLGDLSLWGGYYRQAAQYYHDYVTRLGSEQVTGSASVGWIDTDFESLMDTYASWLSSSSEILTVIPMEEDEYSGVISHLDDVFNSANDNYYYYQATHSPRLDELSRSQLFTLIYNDPVTLLPDTINPPSTVVYSSDIMRGDLRLWSVYSLNTLVSSSSAYSTAYQTCYKYNSFDMSVTILRRQHVYLRMAEALNRAGLPQSAFAVLKYGLCKDNIDKYISADERAKAGDLLNYSEYVFTRNNTLGTHSHGSGNANGEKTYAIPALPTLADSILYVENAICDEMALETQAEGMRYYDLMRLAIHRGDPTFLADKVARRQGSANFDADLYQLLSNQQNWYLPLK